MRWLVAFVVAFVSGIVTYGAWASSNVKQHIASCEIEGRHIYYDHVLPAKAYVPECMRVNGFRYDISLPGCKAVHSSRRPDLDTYDIDSYPDCYRGDNWLAKILRWVCEV